ncbi:uncharacterized protein LOC113794657 [Dermatophagoides pteronyssinus]|uniref:Uncharacterized protein LOC113794657 n=1 Tax=Dermatophagoides pteronyssinus TaxID=6956 RepID=A0A6P6Y7U1_DERPT|nr:uncharacterized protein LOC113794657 [Dermatophagoides pteronyssinus]
MDKMDDFKNDSGDKLADKSVNDSDDDFMDEIVDAGDETAKEKRKEEEKIRKKMRMDNNLNIDFVSNYYDKDRKIFMHELYQFPSFDSRTISWLENLNRIPFDMDSKDQLKGDIIKIIDKINDDLVGDEKLFLNYLPEQEWRKLISRLIYEFPSIRNRFNRFNAESGSKTDPLITYMMKKVRNGKSKLNQMNKRKRDKLTTTIEVKTNE